MLTDIRNFIMYSASFLSLFLIDYILGNGFVDMCQRIFCKLICFIRKTIKEEEKQAQMMEDDTVSLPVLVTEIMFLGLTIAFLNKYKLIRGNDRIDDLLQESREALRQTNEFLEKWRLRRIKWQVPNEYTYLDEEPQEIRPYKLEVPILHMAIVDTLGTTRNQPESGDAGDHISFTDSALLSMTSLLDDDFESMPDVTNDEKIDECDNSDHRNRILWDVLEEDVNLDE